MLATTLASFFCILFFLALVLELHAPIVTVELEDTEDPYANCAGVEFSPLDEMDAQLEEENRAVRVRQAQRGYLRERLGHDLTLARGRHARERLHAEMTWAYQMEVGFRAAMRERAL